MSTMASGRVYLGFIAHWDRGVHAFRGHVAVRDGKIVSVGTSQDVEAMRRRLGPLEEVRLGDEELLVPGLIDCHLHAPQFPNLGLGLDRPLLEWLKEYTFPLESHYKDVDFANGVYRTVVQRTLRHGTTTACYFGTLHLDSSVALAAAVERHGQRALVGKVSMNVPNDADYYNATDVEIQETETFIKLIRSMDNDLIEPVVTPRFALSCDEELMRELGLLAAKYNCKIQTHISENIHEVRAVKDMFPNQKTYADVYYHAKLLNDKCILAHAIYLEESEMELLSRKRVSVAHCPASNTRLMSGLCPVKKLMKHRITVGLGTDVSGGDSASILDAMRRCMDVSSHLYLTNDGYSKQFDTVNWEEAFFLATMGGAKALSLEQKVGNFEIGKEFDALIIDVFHKHSPIDKYETLHSITALNPTKEEQQIKQLLQRFIYLGNDKNIKKVYVKGREITF